MDGLVVGIQHVVRPGQHSLPVFHQADPDPEADEAGGDLPDQPTLKRGQQHQRNHAEVDDPADTDEPDGSLQLLIDKRAVQEQENEADHADHELVGDQADGDSRGAVGHRYAGLAQGVDLHRLAAAGARGDIAVIETDQGDAGHGADTKRKPLFPQAEPGAQRVPGATELRIAEGDAEDRGHG